MKHSFSVIIPNYNTWHLVERAVNSLIQHDEEWIEEIIVVDDCSPIQNHINFPSIVKLIRNETNLHYTKTVNKGLQLAQGSLVLIFDSDAVAIQPFLGSIASHFTNNNTLGCVGFNTTDDEGNSHKNYITEPSVLSLISGQQLHKLLRSINFLASKHILPFSCAVALKNDCLKELGYLDEQFYYLDADNDLCMRIYRSKNWTLKYDASISVYHVGGNSIAQNANRVIEFYQSRWQLLQKHHKIPLAKLVRTLILLRVAIEYIALILVYKFNYKHYKVIGRKKLLKTIAKF